MKFNIRYLILGILLVISTMVIATQFALSEYTYQYRLPSDYGIHFIGSDNSSDGIRVLRADENGEIGDLKIVLGNVSAAYQMCYSAAFGIVNENLYCMYIAGVNVSSSDPIYLKIWLHGNPNANANFSSDDPSSILLYNNGTIVHPYNKTAWTLAPGDKNINTTCYNITDRGNFSNFTFFDNIANARYSLNNTNVSSGMSDFVWVQVELNISPSANYTEKSTGVIYIHFTRREF